MNQAKNISFCVVSLMTGLCLQAFAGPSTTQTVSYEVRAINEITVSGSPSLIISTATAGSAPDAVTAAGTYNITTNSNSARKITGALDSNMVAGVTLSVTLGAPTGASATKQPLTTAPVDLVTGISKLNETGKTITYELQATSAAGEVAAATKTVTYTITAG